MATIGSLVIEMSANVASLKSDLDKGRREFQRFAGDAAKSLGGIEGSLRGLRTAFGALGIGLGVRELINFGASLLHAAAGLKELSQQMGVSIDFLQSLQDVAATSGVSFDKLESALQFLRKSMGLAVDGSKEIIDSLNLMGVKILDASGKTRSSEAVFRDIADAYVAAEDKAKFLGEASKVLGRSMQELVPIFAKGSAGIDEAAVGMNHLTDAQAEAADKVEDDFNRMMLSAKRWAEGLVVDVAPGVESFFQIQATAFDKNLEEANALWTALKAGWTEYVNFTNQLDFDIGFSAALDRMLRKYIDVTNQIENDIRNGTGFFTPAPPDALQKVLNDLRPSAVDAAAGIVGGLSPLPAITVGPPPEVVGSVGPTGGHRAPTGPQPLGSDAPGVRNPPPKPTGGTGAAKRDPVGDMIRDLRFQIAQLNRTPVDQAIFAALERAKVDLASGPGQQIADLVTQFEGLKTAEADAEQAFKRAAAQSAENLRIATARGEIVESYRREIEQQEALNDALAQGAKAYAEEAKFQEIASRFRELGAPLRGAEIDQAKELAAALVGVERVRELDQAMQDLATTVSEDLAGGLADLITGARSAEEVLAQLFNTLLKGLDDYLNAQSKASGGSGSWLGDLLGSLLGGGDLFGGGGSTPGGAGNDIFGFAGGGRPPVGRISMVGEHGPELFVPDSAGTVLPHGVEAALAGGGGGMVVNIDARGATRDMVPVLVAEVERLGAEQVRLRRDVPGMAIGAVKNERARSMSMRRVFN